MTRGHIPSAWPGWKGFLHHFTVTIRAYDGYLDLEPHASSDGVRLR